MTTELHTYGAERCLLLAEDGETIGDAEGARAMIEEAMGERATLVAVPVERLAPAFFELRTGVLGEITQKMVNYRLKLAVVGDISPHIAASDAFRDLVVEADRSDNLVFVRDLAALEQRLEARGANR